MDYYNDIRGLRYDHLFKRMINIKMDLNQKIND